MSMLASAGTARRISNKSSCRNAMHPAVGVIAGRATWRKIALPLPGTDGSSLYPTTTIRSYRLSSLHNRSWLPENGKRTCMLYSGSATSSHHASCSFNAETGSAVTGFSRRSARYQTRRSGYVPTGVAPSPSRFVSFIPPFPIAQRYVRPEKRQIPEEETRRCSIVTEFYSTKKRHSETEAARQKQRLPVWLITDEEAVEQGKKNRADADENGEKDQEGTIAALPS